VSKRGTHDGIGQVWMKGSPGATRCHRACSCAERVTGRFSWDGSAARGRCGGGCGGLPGPSSCCLRV